MVIKVAYQGEPGAYSDEAAQRLFAGATTVGLPTFREVFSAASSPDFQAAVLPVENSLAGVVQEVSDLLWSHPALAIEAEHVAPIRHHLLARDRSTVRRAYSHPQALAQCAGWLRDHQISPVVFPDTAGAARFIAEEGHSGDAAIASEAAAQRYQLSVIASDIADDPSNQTRFLVVRPTPPNQLSDHLGPARLSCGFLAEHRPGGLLAVLSIFAQRGLNLTRLDSRPVPEEPFRYRFYADVDLEGLGGVEPLLDQLRSAAAELRVFGLYPAAGHSVPTA